MNPFWLTFRNEAVESDYERHMLHRSFWCIDRLFLLMSLALAGSLFLRGISENEQTASVVVATRVFGLNLILIVGMLIARYALGLQGMEKWRTPLTILFRIASAGCLAVSFQDFHWMFSMHDSYLGAIFDSLVSNEAIASIVVGFGLRLKFKHHLPTSFLTITLLFFAKGEVFCQHVTCTPSGHTFMLIEQKANYIAGKIMRMMYTKYIVRYLVQRDKEPCLHLVTFIHVFIAIGVVSYALWLVERNSRVNFVESLINNDNVDQGNIPQVRRIPRVQYLHHAFLIAISFAVSWEFLCLLTPYVKLYGKRMTEDEELAMIEFHASRNSSFLQ